MRDVESAKRVFGLCSSRTPGRKPHGVVSEAYKETHRAQFERFLALHNEGKTFTEIAKICGCCLFTVGKLFKVFGYSFDTAYKTRACHAAVKGKKRSLDDLCKRAISKERNPPKPSRWETLFSDFLSAQGFDFTFSKAVGKYNLDFAVGDSVAVELFGGAFHGQGRAAARLHERMEYLINSGWNVYIIWCLSNEACIFPRCLNDFIAFFEHTRGNKTAVGQYRVIWSDGDFIASGSLESDYLAAIKPPTFRHNALAKYKTPGD